MLKSLTKDALDLTLSRGSGEVVCLFQCTTQLGFRNIVLKPQLVRVQKAVEVFVLHSVLIQHSRQPQTATNIRRLLWSQEVQWPPSIGLRTSCDPRSLRTRQIQLLRSHAQPLFRSNLFITNRKEVGVCFSLHGVAVRCGDAQAAACCECLRAMVEGLLGNCLYLVFLSTAVDSGAV